MASPGRRAFSRVHVGLQVTLYFDGIGSCEGKLRDVSLGGLYAECDLRPTAGTGCRVFLRLSGSAMSLSLRAAGKVARVDEGGVAVELDEIGSEAFDSLFRLVLLNGEEPDRIEREREERLGLGARSRVVSRDGSTDPREGGA